MTRTRQRLCSLQSAPTTSNSRTALFTVAPSGNVAAADRRPPHWQRAALALPLACAGLVAEAQPASASVSNAGQALPEVQVRGSGERADGPVHGYRASRSATAAKVDAPLLETPASVSVVGARQLEDRGITDLSLAADTVAGVQRQLNYGYPFSTSYVIRGFRTDGAASTINGFREFGFTSAREGINIERIEFLKGPASVLYGSSFAIGGLVNHVTKQPRNERFTDLSLSAGGQGHRRASIDTNLPLTDDGRWLLRATAAAGEDDRLLAFNPKRYRFVSPVVSFQPFSGGRLVAELAAFDGRTGGRDGDGLYPFRAAYRLPDDFKVGDTWSRGEQTTQTARLEWTHAIDDRLEYRLAAFRNAARQSYSGLTPDFDAPVGVDDTVYPRRAGRGRDTQRDTTLQAEVRRKLEWGDLRHQLLAGVERSRYRFGPYEFFSAPYPSLDVDNPVHGYPEPADSEYTLNYPAQTYGARSTAFYLQDFIEWGPRWRFLVGARYDRVSSYYRDVGTVFNAQDESAVSPRVGVVYLIDPRTSLFASAARSFVPNSFGRSPSGDLYPAETGKQIEAGVKRQMLSGRLTTTATVFELRRTNVLTTDPTNPDFSIPTAEQKSTGFEWELAGRPIPDLQLTAAYSHTDAVVSKDNSLPVGDRLVGAARHNANLWTRLELARWGWPQLAVGGGVFYSSERQLALPNNGLTLPAATRVDLAAYWKLNASTRLQLNLNNVTDRKLFETGGFYLVPQPGRTLRAALQASF